jgi:hypothetical protein
MALHYNTTNQFTTTVTGTIDVIIVFGYIVD